MRIKMNIVRNTRSSLSFVLYSLLSLSTAACGTSDSAPQANGLSPKSPAHAIHVSTPTSTEEAKGGALTPDHNAASDKPSTINGLKPPESFSVYASEPIGDGKLCVVGASTDDDGMNQKPIIYVVRTDKRLMWVAQLDLPADTYQGRATHCSRYDGALLVLLQSDTQASRAMSQTLLRVEKIDVSTGAIEKTHDINIPDAYTAWVDVGPGHFQWKGNLLTVSGSYRTGPDQNHSMPFTVHLNNDLSP